MSKIKMNLFHLSVAVILYCHFKIIIIKCMEDTSINIPFTNIHEETDDESTSEITETTYEKPDEKWILSALKDIAYFLRNYKFNEWDRRYFSKKPDFIGFYSAYPTPPLRSLHWKVYENCDKYFYKCIIYLHSIIETSPFTRGDDTVTILNENIIPLNKSLRSKLDQECKNAMANSENSGLPFDGPIEKFQWRTSAAYYMCWYTMLETPELAFLEELCDNFANCLDPKFGSNNKDPRADDNISYACALYSFCPDPCCPIKHIDNYNNCYENESNPCYAENNNKRPIDKICSMNREDNTNFRSIVENKLNVSCHCNDIGFEWNSENGMCIDINECTVGIHNCSKTSENCLNMPGSFICVCKWGYNLNENGECVYKNIFEHDNNFHFKQHYNLIKNLVKRIYHYFGI